MKEAPSPEQQPAFPKNLTARDKELIIEQCEHQGAMSKEEIEGFAQAYLEAKELAADPEQVKALTPENWQELILRFGTLVDAEANQHGFRTTPVRFSMTNFAIPPGQVPQAIKSLCRFISRLDPLELYTEFETIHPFNDGNGRVGDLLWKMATKRDTGKWPEQLPPDVFGEQKEEASI